MQAVRPFPRIMVLRSIHSSKKSATSPLGSMLQEKSRTIVSIWTEQFVAIEPIACIIKSWRSHRRCLTVWMDWTLNVNGSQQNLLFWIWNFWIILLSIIRKFHEAICFYIRSYILREKGYEYVYQASMMSGFKQGKMYCSSTRIIYLDCLSGE